MSIVITRMVFHLREYLSVSPSSLTKERSNALTKEGVGSTELDIISTAFAFKTIEMDIEIGSTEGRS